MGIMSQIMNQVKNITYGNKYFETALVLRESMFVKINILLREHIYNLKDIYNYLHDITMV